MKLRTEKRAIELASQLGFDDCIKVLESLEAGSPMFDIISNRLDEIDPEKYEKWLDNECGYCLIPA